MRALDVMLAKIKSAAIRHGAEPMDTPMMERSAFLGGKYGEESKYCSAPTWARWRRVGPTRSSPSAARRRPFQPWAAVSESNDSFACAQARR
jgi:hypothetical protein